MSQAYVCAGDRRPECIGCLREESKCVMMGAKEGNCQGSVPGVRARTVRRSVVMV